MSDQATETAEELALRAKKIAEDVSAMSADVFGALLGAPGVGSLATALEVLAEAVVALVRERQQ